MESLNLEKENIIKEIKNLFRLKKELNHIAIKDIKNLFRIEKETKAIRDRILRDMKNLFEYEEEDYYKTVIVNNFWSNNYIEYKSKVDRKTLSVEQYFNKIKPYLRDTINDLKKSNTWKIQLTISINFISSKDDNDEECEMHSKSSNIEIMMNDKADEVLELEESMKGSEFVFDFVHLLYYKCHKINPNHSGSYIDSPD